MNMIISLLLKNMISIIEKRLKKDCYFLIHHRILKKYINHIVLIQKMYQALSSINGDGKNSHNNEDD